jgi:hypothetical protein
MISNHSKADIKLVLIGLFVLFFVLAPFFGPLTSLMIVAGCAGAVLFIAVFGTIKHAFALLFVGAFLLMWLIGGIQSLIGSFSAGQMDSSAMLVALAIGVMVSAGVLWFFDAKRSRQVNKEPQATPPIPNRYPVTTTAAETTTPAPAPVKRKRRSRKTPAIKHDHAEFL